MPVLLATLSSLVYGTADFMGGLASQRNHGVIVTAVPSCGGWRRWRSRWCCGPT